MSAPTTAARTDGLRRHVPAAFGLPGFRRLLLTRLGGQVGDGLFQASLAGAVLFSPEHQASAAGIAAAFAVVLLPYSLVGPVAGVLLDRWWRQRVLVWVNVVRALLVIGVAAEIAAGVAGPLFYGSALVIISFNRFILAGLSASLPHVVPQRELVSANAVSTTLGSTATAVGLGIGIGVAGLIGTRDGSYAWTAASSLLLYLSAALAARGFARSALGPDDVERSHHETVGDVVRGFADGARHLAEIPAARRALAMIGAARFCYGVGFVMILLLFRYRLEDVGPFRSGLAGLGFVAVAVAAGGLAAAFCTPRATRAFGFVKWSTALLVVAGVVQVVLGLPYLTWTYVIGAFLLGFAAQGTKICVDTILQRTIEDEYRGRVFSLYDTLLNVTTVVAAIAVAVFLPTDGYAPWVVVVLGVGYVVTGLAYLRAGVQAGALHAGCASAPGPTAA